MSNFLTVIAFLITLASGYWMSSDYVISYGSIFISSTWGSIGLAAGACLMILSIRRKKETHHD